MMRSLPQGGVFQLGIGHNGHIGFNEPRRRTCKNTQCVDLAETRWRMKKFEKDVPRQAYLVGMAAVVRAKKILLVAFRRRKSRHYWR